MMMISKNRKAEKSEVVSNYHVVHKVPPGDGPYVRAKHVQVSHSDPKLPQRIFFHFFSESEFYTMFNIKPFTESSYCSGLMIPKCGKRWSVNIRFLIFSLFGCALGNLVL